MGRPPPDWLVQDIAAGMMMLATLGLRGAPEQEVIKAQCVCWARAVHRLAPWLRPMRDSARILEAFEILVATRRTWPYPADLLKALGETTASPPQPPSPPLALPAPGAPTPAGVKALREVRRLLDPARGEQHAG